MCSAWVGGQAQKQIHWKGLQLDVHSDPPSSPLSLPRGVRALNFSRTLFSMQ